MEVRPASAHIDYDCDYCGRGQMRPIYSLDSEPPQVLHRCANCDSEQWFHVCYPAHDQPTRD